ncbi:unnamed protein product, partial [Musa textilis]
MGVDFAAGVMAMAVVAAAVAGSAAQSPPDCASNLVGCAGYLTSTTTPPDSCCGPLKQAAKSELPCLCSLFNNTAILRAFNVNITQAIQMSKRCGVSTDQRACATAVASGTSKPPHPPLPSSTFCSTLPSREDSGFGPSSLDRSDRLILVLTYFFVLFAAATPSSSKNNTGMSS